LPSSQENQHEEGNIERKRNLGLKTGEAKNGRTNERLGARPVKSFVARRKGDSEGVLELEGQKTRGPHAAEQWGNRG